MKYNSHHNGFRLSPGKSAAHQYAQNPAHAQAPPLADRSPLLANPRSSNPRASNPRKELEQHAILAMGVTSISADQYPYHMAALLNDMTALQGLCDGQIEHEDPQGATPLYYAMLSRSIDAIRHLLKHGADRHHANHYGITPLMIAEQLNDCDVILLLQHPC